MAQFRVNGLAVLSATIVQPLRGAWRVDCELDSTQVISGVATMTDNVNSWTGTISECTEFAGVLHTVLVPGAGSVQTALPAAAWTGASLRTILSDTLRAAGESLSSESDTLSDQWDHYVRLPCTLGVAMSRMATLYGGLWRYDDAGRVVIARAAYTSISQPYRVLHRHPRLGQMTIVSDTLFARPGQSLDGIKIDAVEHQIRASGVRTIITQGD